MTKKQYTSVIVTGSIAYDEIMDFPKRFIDFIKPDKLHQLNVAFVVDKLDKQIGGIAINIAYNIALLTKKTVYILGAVGKDGNKIINFLKKNNIKTDYIFEDKRLYTSTGVVITDIGDNQIWGYYYGASKLVKKIDIKKYEGSKSLWIISANHPEAFLYFQKKAIRNNTTYIYDPGMSLTWITDKDLREGVMHAHYLVGNDYEIAMILKRLHVSINQLINTGIRVITTLGEKGVRLEFQVHKVHKVYKVSAFKVKKVVDPTGAGDAWRGGFVAGLVKGLPIKDCLKIGNVLASFAIEKYGTVNHKPSKKEIKKRIKQLNI